MDVLRKEIAYIAYHFHWNPEVILAMEHKERQDWVKQVADINRKINQSRQTED